MKQLIHTWDSAVCRWFCCCRRCGRRHRSRSCAKKAKPSNNNNKQNSIHTTHMLWISLTHGVPIVETDSYCITLRCDACKMKTKTLDRHSHSTKQCAHNTGRQTIQRHSIHRYKRTDKHQANMCKSVRVCVLCLVDLKRESPQEKQER